MKNPIAAVYWRLVKTGKRSYETVPENLKEEVKELAMEELSAGTITEEQFKNLVG